MVSTCFGHLHVHLQEFLYIGCFTAACGVMPCWMWSACVGVCQLLKIEKCTVKHWNSEMLTTVFSVSRHFTHPSSNSHITAGAVNAASYRRERRYETDPNPLHATHRANCIECSHQKPKFFPKSYYISARHGCVSNKFAVQNGSLFGSDSAFPSGKNRQFLRIMAKNA